MLLTASALRQAASDPRRRDNDPSDTWSRSNPCCRLRSVETRVRRVQRRFACTCPWTHPLWAWLGLAHMDRYIQTHTRSDASERLCSSTRLVTQRSCTDLNRQRADLARHIRARWNKPTTNPIQRHNLSEQQAVHAFETKLKELWEILLTLGDFGRKRVYSPVLQATDTNVNTESSLRLSLCVSGP